MYAFYQQNTHKNDIKNVNMADCNITAISN